MILLVKSLQPVRELVLVPLGLGLDGDDGERIGDLRKRQLHGCRSVAQRVSDMRMLQLDAGADLSRRELLGVDAILAVQQENRPDALGVAVARVLNVEPLVKLAAVDAHEEVVAHVGLREATEGLCQGRRAGVGPARDAILCAGSRAHDVAHVLRTGRKPRQKVENLRDAASIPAACRKHRIDGARGHAPRQPLAELVVGQRAGLEKLFDQLVRGLRGRIHEGFTRLGDRVGHLCRNLARLCRAALEHPGLALDDVDDTLKCVSVADGKQQRHDLVRQALAHLADDAVEVGVLLVHLVDDDETRLVLLVQGAPDVLRPGLELGVRLDENQGGLDRGDAPQTLGDEVVVAGRIDEVEAVAVPFAGGELGLHRDAAFCLFGGEVEVRVPLVDAAEPRGLLRRQKHRFEEAGLARILVTQQREIADLVDCDLLQVTRLLFLEGPTTTKRWIFVAGRGRTPESSARV